jgi:hypothetical protein
MSEKLNRILATYYNEAAVVFVVEETVRAEARGLIALYDSALNEPATLDVVRRWLARITAAVKFMPDKEGMTHRALAIAQVCEGRVPLCAFNTETQTAAMARFKDFPSAAEVLELLSDATAVLRLRRRALEGVSQGKSCMFQPAAVPEPPAMTPEQRAAASELMRALFGNMGVGLEISPGGSASPSPRVDPGRQRNPPIGAELRPEHLITVWAAHEHSPNPEIRAVAKVRLAALRAKLPAGSGAGDDT